MLRSSSSPQRECEDVGSWHSCSGTNSMLTMCQQSVTQRVRPVLGVFVVVCLSVLSMGVSQNVVTYIGAGREQSCAIMSPGALWCWGENPNGGVGDGTTTFRRSPVRISTMSSGVTAVSCGNNHACAVKSGGLWCWGDNSNGQLGVGTNTQHNSPVAVSSLSSNINAIATGTYHTCAIQSGDLYCWGQNTDGEVGDGTNTDKTSPTLIIPSVATDVACGERHTCAVKSDGSLWCWGSNGSGQLGDGTTTSHNTPMQVSGMTTGVTSVGTRALGNTCAIQSGVPYCWGDNASGQLGDGTTTRRLTPVQVSTLTSSVSDLVAGPSFTCALLTTGGVQCWGDNTDGENW